MQTVGKLHSAQGNEILSCVWYRDVAEFKREWTLNIETLTPGFPDAENRADLVDRIAIYMAENRNTSYDSLLGVEYLNAV